MQHLWTDPNTSLSAIASYRLQSLSPDDSLLTAARLIGRSRISSLPVLDANRRPVGILTERILLKALHNELPPQEPLKKVMGQPVTVPPTISCQEAYQICLREDVRHLILVDQDQRALALVSETDFRRHLNMDAPSGQTPVASIMRRFVCVLSPDTPLQTALAQMYDRFIGTIVVVENQRPVGILSQRDLARLYLASPEKRLDRLAEVMTQPVHTIVGDTTLADAATAMLGHGIRQYPVVDEAGLLIGLLSSLDLLQSMAFGLTDAALEQEANTSQSLLEQAPFALTICGVDDNLISFVNDRAQRQFALKQQEMLGAPMRDFLCAPEAWESLCAQLQQQGKIFDIALTLTNARGKYFQTLVSCSLITYRNQPAILTAINDISEQQRASEHQQRERAKLHALLQTIPDLLWVKDPDGRYLVCNPVFERFFGAPQADILGKTDYDFVSAAQADFFRNNDQLAIASGRPRCNEEWLEFADGSYQGLFEAIKTPLEDENGNLIGVLGIARDITDRRREQRDLRERVKEQQCLYRVFALTENIQPPFSQQLLQVVELIPQGWQYPEITAASISYQEKVYATTNFHPSPWTLTAEAVTGQGEALQLTIAYQEERPRENEGPFFHEERALADAIIHRLAEVAERRYTLEAVKIRDELIASMFAQSTDAIILLDAQSQRFVDFNSIAASSLGYTHDEFAKLTVNDIQIELSPEQIAAEQDRVLRGEAVSIETKHRHKDGSFRDVALTLRPLSLQGKQLISVVWQDITEQKARERELEESQKRLKAITDSALDAILMMDRRGNISYWNPAAERMLGYRPDEVMGMNLHQMLAPERFHAKHHHAFNHFLQTGVGRVVGKTIELAALCKDGAEIIISLSLSSVLLNDEWHAVGILRDISAVKQHQAALEAALEEAKAANHAKTEVLTHLEEMVQARTAELDAVNEQLRISEERYALALEATSDGLWDWNIGSGELYCSPAYYRMLGYSPGELAPNQNASGFDLIHPDDRERVTTSLRRQMMQQDNLEIEFRLMAKKGEPVWVLSRGKVVSRTPAGHPQRCVGIHTDLTSRKHIELELRRASDEQEAIFNAAASGIGFIRDRKVVRCNRKLEEIFGYAPGEMIGEKTRGWYTSEEEFIAFGAQIAHDLRTAGRFYSERELRRRDGSLFWARLHARAWDPTDISKGLVGLLDDITEERKAAEALRKAKDEAEAATRAKSEFLANMSHEIRTPMNAIIGFAHLIKRDPLSPQQLHQLDKLADASRHLLHIINDILDLSKIEANKMILDIDDFEPARVVEHVCNILQDKAQIKQIELRSDLQHIPLMLRGDGPRLGQILLNLVGNAVKFTEKGQVSITVSAVSTMPEQIVLRFTVADTGIGMNEDQVARIFKAFEQADSSTTRRFGGTGLGLAISQQLVELMGGRIGVASRIGRGTEFWFEVPLTPSTKLPRLRHGGNTLKGQTALVIDDSPESREILAAMLQEMGMEVQTTASGPGGLQQIKDADRSDAPFALVIVDWQLGESDGITLMEQLPRLHLQTTPKLLMITAHGEAPSLEAAQEAGISRILVKPVTASQLLDTLVEIMPVVQQTGYLPPSQEQSLQKRREAHILLVEDNIVNQEVAFMLLESMGMHVTVANNGADAVALVGQEPYDLVFMDIQMPIMDGLEATRAIRRLPGRGDTPILAMTANAFSEDRERCLEAGMNDHIAKPIELEKLQHLLNKWIPERTPAHPPQVEVPVASKDDQSAIRTQLATIAQLDVEAGLRLLLGDEPAYLRLLGQFVEQHGRDADSLHTLVQLHDWSTVREKAHALKGAAATLGIWDINDIAAAMERNVRETPDQDQLLQSVAQLQPALASFCQRVGEIMATTAVCATEEKIDQQRADDILQQLAALLRIEDSAANDLFDEEQSHLRAAFGSRIQPLGRQLDAFDYTDALATIQSLLQHHTSPSSNSTSSAAPSP